MPKKNAYGKKNGSMEKIHGKKTKVGKEVGQRVAKRATSAIKGRNAELRRLGLL